VAMLDSPASRHGPPPAPDRGAAGPVRPIQTTSRRGALTRSVQFFIHCRGLCLSACVCVSTHARAYGIPYGMEVKNLTLGKVLI
jgi:hypothetical protein